MKRRTFLAGSLVCTAAPAMAAVSVPGGLRLANDRWAVEIEPSTLAVTVKPKGAAAVQVSRGVGIHAAAGLTLGDGTASWRWDDKFDIACTLIGADLNIQITANVPGEIALLDQPPAAMGKGLLLPIAEGYYVSTDDARWRASLDRDERSTNEDLSLPLWGLDHGEFALHWLLFNPFNNMLNFKAEGGSLSVALRHEFTRLAPTTPMSMTLHLSGPDLLAGAKRYRRHLIEQGGFRTLADKIHSSPSAAKLIGATHLYLWDNGLLGVRDVRDWPAFLALLRGSASLPVRMRSRFDHDGAELIRTAQLHPLPYLQRAIVQTCNAALNDLARERWQQEAVNPAEIVAAYSALRREAVATFSHVLAPDPATWGASLSESMFEKLKVAGLDRLWIGLGDGWEGGLWRPEAVRAAVDRGYLIAPYDSYETAIPPGKRPDWTTAQLGRTAYERCGVVKADGTLTAGFQQTGRYTNTRCVTPILKSRVPLLAHAGGYNSWFLDVFATGMVFDDYRPDATMTMAENSTANVAAMRWISEAEQLPLGSEGGDAINAAGTIFAHGMETPGFGWGDADLRKNKQSPFFLGSWYPAAAPSVFFKSVPLKEPYLSLYFDPTTRLPLYQAAFHDAVIVSSHWSFDQLKLSNVASDRALAQQLYNVPPLFHLSIDTLAVRLPAILRHDAFFQVLHRRLAQQALIGFEWLTEDRLVQRTRFVDGTQLIANFAEDPRSLDRMSLRPRSVTAVIEGRPSQVFEA